MSSLVLNIMTGQWGDAQRRARSHPQEIREEFDNLSALTQALCDPEGVPKETLDMLLIMDRRYSLEQRLPLTACVKNGGKTPLQHFLETTHEEDEEHEDEKKHDGSSSPPTQSSRVSTRLRVSVVVDLFLLHAPECIHIVDDEKGENVLHFLVRRACLFYQESNPRQYRDCCRAINYVRAMEPLLLDWKSSEGLTPFGLADREYTEKDMKDEIWVLQRMLPKDLHKGSVFHRLVTAKCHARVLDAFARNAENLTNNNNNNKTPTNPNTSLDDGSNEAGTTTTDTVDAYGNTPLHRAVLENPFLVAALAEHPGEASRIQNTKGKYPIDLALERRGRGSLDRRAIIALIRASPEAFAKNVRVPDNVYPHLLSSLLYRPTRQAIDTCFGILRERKELRKEELVESGSNNKNTSNMNSNNNNAQQTNRTKRQHKLFPSIQEEFEAFSACFSDVCN